MPQYISYPCSVNSKVSTELYDRLAALVGERGTKMSNLVREILEDYVKTLND